MVTKMKPLITVSRQFGSGGRELGRRLAEDLGIEYYDREIVKAISERTELSENYVKQIVDRTPHSLYPITVGQTFSYTDQYEMSQIMAVFTAQSDIVKELAAKSPCLIVGRCADYILRDEKPLRLFVYSSIESRMARCFARAEEDEKLTEKQMIKHIKKVDRERARYYNYYTGQTWGDMQYYDLCINTTNADIKALVSSVSNLFK